MILYTRRLILRPGDISDAEELYKYASDPSVGPAAGWMPHKSVEDSAEIIKTVLSKPENYAVVLRETGKPVGCAGIIFPGDSDFEMQEHEAEIGYWLGVPYWGQGLIPEAVRELQHRCFEQLGCTGIWCGYYDGNEKSRRVQEKCGFKYRMTRPDMPRPIMGDRKTEHFTYISKQEWVRLWSKE